MMVLIGMSYALMARMWWDGFGSVIDRDVGLSSDDEDDMIDDLMVLMREHYTPDGADLSSDDDDDDDTCRCNNDHAMTGYIT